MKNIDVKPVAQHPHPSPAIDETNPECVNPHPLLIKRSRLAELLDMGCTLLRELHTPGHSNWDPLFPKPIKLTSNGSAYYLMSEVLAWVASRAHERDSSPQGKTGSSTPAPFVLVSSGP